MYLASLSCLLTHSICTLNFLFSLIWKSQICNLIIYVTVNNAALFNSNYALRRIRFQILSTYWSVLVDATLESICWNVDVGPSVVARILFRWERIEEYWKSIQDLRCWHCLSRTLWNTSFSHSKCHAILIWLNIITRMLDSLLVKILSFMLDRPVNSYSTENLWSHLRSRRCPFQWHRP
jgi:hypothetical protein